MGSHDNTKPPTRLHSISIPLSFEESTTVLLSVSMDSNKLTTVVDPVSLPGDAESQKKAAADSGNDSGGRKSDSGVYVDTARSALKQPQQQQVSELQADEEESPSSPTEDIYGGAEIDDTQDEPESPEDVEDQEASDLTIDNQRLPLSTIDLKKDSTQTLEEPDTTSPESPPILLSPPVQPEFSLAANGGATPTHPGSFLRRQPSVHVTPPTSPSVEAFDSSAPSISSLLEQEAAVLASTKETGEEISIETSDPSHLFWVPASQHPEIAPAEFNNWLKKHGYTSANRSGPSRMKRRKSILSVSYKPEDIDAEVDQEEVVEKEVEAGAENDKRRPTLGILEEDYDVDRIPMPPKRLGGYLRRSISLNVPQVRDPDDIHVFNKNSSPDDQSPVIVPRDQGRPILRRSARTKIRRNSVDDGAPSEPGESRRWSSSIQGQHRRSQSHDVLDKPHISTSPPKSKPTPLSEQFPAPPPRGAIPVGGVTLRDEPVVTPAADIGVTSADIGVTSADIGVTSADIGVTSADIEVSPDTASSATDASVPLPKKNTVVNPFVSRLREPDREVISLTPKKEPSPDQEQEEIKEDSLESAKRIVSTTPRSSSLITLTADGKGKATLTLSGSGATTTVPVAPSPSISASTSSVGLSRKSTWSWLFSSEDKEKLKKAKFEVPSSLPDAQASANKIASKDIVPPKSPKEPDTASIMSGDSSSSKKFGLSSLFSRSSKVPINPKPVVEVTPSTQAVAAAPTSELQTIKKPKYSNYNRLPIHVERAIYRLSHIKLANPRRPLHHQVLISNLMFWYLSVVNQQGQNGGSAARQQQPRSPQDPATKKKKNQQGGKKRRKADGIQKKNKPPNGQSRPRAAETAIRAPQYDIQQQIIAQQYRTNQTQQMHQSQQGPQIYPAQDSRYPFIQPAGPSSYTNLNSMAESIPVNPQMSMDEYDLSANDADSNYDDEESEYDFPVVNSNGDDEKYDHTTYKPRFAGKAAAQGGYSSDGSDGSDEVSTPQNPAQASQSSLELGGLDPDMTTFSDELLTSFGMSNSEVRSAGNKVASGGRTTVNAPAASAIGLGNANGNVSMNGHGNHRQPPALDIKNPRRSRSPNPPIVRGKSPVPSIGATESEVDDEDDVPLAVYARTH